MYATAGMNAADIAAKVESVLAQGARTARRA
jgi:hypothetical protein